MADTPAVTMIDIADGTLHRCGDTHLNTGCGRTLKAVTVGPTRAVVHWTKQLCSDCFEGPLDLYAL